MRLAQRLLAYAKSTLERAAAVFENFSDTMLDEGTAGEVTDWPKRQRVVEDVECLRPARHLADVVLMVPEPARTRALFVDEELAINDVASCCGTGEEARPALGLFVQDVGDGETHNGFLPWAP